MERKDIHLKDAIAALPARRQKRIAAYTSELRTEMALAELRGHRKQTQVAIARRLRTTQGEISRLEKREDMHLSTIRRFVEGLGGRVEVIAMFPDEKAPIPLTFGVSSPARTIMLLKSGAARTSGSLPGRSSQKGSRTRERANSASVQSGPAKGSAKKAAAK